MLQLKAGSSKTIRSMTAPIQDAIVLLGDSLTQGGWEPNGFAQRLASAYVRKMDVVNRGFSGYNTEWAIPVFEQFLAPTSKQSYTQKIRLLTIWYGANDACLPSSVQHVPIDKYESNLTHLIHMVRDPSSTWHSPETRILLITPPPINLHQWLESKDPDGTTHKKDRDFGVTAEYAQKVRDVGAKEKIPVVDVWKALWDAAGQKEDALSRYLSDGLHLTPEGYSVVYEELITTIKEYAPDLHHENLREVFVRWNEVDSNNPRACLMKRSIEA
ncbi:SGNH hydrolase [Fomitiporia mediterranea MF3/22]|uniref:SGNH hydrolase n=1 Tax=Fomitiporia mediterranea (strain MF3/22) TaxID=694068 RepID=UPI00044079F2|nr:SGNH hydrolase [Fomitiporia mediterranea MF3/22]EJD06068.1 SGNH hydrolase [Fomitiporia mediterranea MF3/22]